MAQARHRLGQAGALICAGLIVGCSGLESSKPLNAAPTFVSTAPTKLPNGKAVKPGLTYVYQATATDPDTSDTATLRMVLGPANGAFSNGMLTWTPTTSQAGLEQVFKLEASDGQHVAFQTWSITPEARTAPTKITIAPVGTANPVELHAFAWTLAFEDDDPASATVEVQSPSGAVYIPSNKTIAWTPPAGSFGSVLVQANVTNNVGLSASQQLTSTVDRNKAPDVAYVGISNPNVVEGDTFAAVFTISDPNGDAINGAQVTGSVTYQGLAVQPAAQVTWDTSTGRATLTWTSALNAPYRGKTVALNLSAADTLGATNTLSVPLAVTANLPPTFTPDSTNPTTVQAGGFVTLRTTITDPNGDLVDPATVTAAISYLGIPVTPTPQLTWNPSTNRATITWAPSASAAYVGKAVTLSLAAADAKGASDSRDYSLSVTP